MQLQEETKEIFLIFNLKKEKLTRNKEVESSAVRQRAVTGKIFLKTVWFLKHSKTRLWTWLCPCMRIPTLWSVGANLTNHIPDGAGLDPDKQ